ncbi:calcium-binding protein [Planktothrix sp. FACHB-1365]|uniref:calcium-binding protein n=1 Tax=Planktothrix sp. FACHB-1365 TaxID=2692855 RepID=UPI0016898B21|nr:calcium-binding protein [Planktothrix sp. FACHB-1365]MBD2481080.1 calcium-binding protein [Planktothrix sp. FACHB-1365]
MISLSSPVQLIPDPDGSLRLLASDTSEYITLFQGELTDYPDGLWSLAGDDQITGSIDHENIFANQGQDSVYGGEGNDQVFGGQQNDQIFGEAGDDFLRGDMDNDFMDGGNGNDQLYGGKGDDQIFGQAGKDILSGDLGIDTLTGGEGGDIFILRTDEANSNPQQVDVIADFEWFSQNDKIALTDGLTNADLNYQQLMDYEGDGLVNDTVIVLVQTQEILAVVLNVDDFALDGVFLAANSLNFL